MLPPLKPTTADLRSKDAFNNVRVLAALISGSSFVAVNTAPLPNAADAVLLGTAKRVYLLVSIASFCSTLISVLVATIALEKLGRSAAQDTAEMDFEYVACLTHFFVGVLGACLIVGLRAWISFTCPTFGNIAVSLVASSFILMLHFLPSSLADIPATYVKLLVQRVGLSSPLLMLALGLGVFTLGLGLKGFGAIAALDMVKPSWKICSVRR